MKFTLDTVALLLAAQPCLATMQHRHLHLAKKRLHDLQAGDNDNSDNHTSELKARGGTCAFPSDAGLVSITPGSDNAGWAMSPDQSCTSGSYCPYACPSGQVMAQWKEGSTYATTERMDGGLYCGSDGKATKPFDSKPYCVDGTGTVKAVNNVGSVVSFCQTVLPGNEDILIPNDVQDTLTLAVPDIDYWQSTASHFYINPPGTDSDTGCHWGDESKPIGNWAPYVAGANTDSSGLTYVKLGVNPIWQGSSLYSEKPTFGLKIECSGDCVGLPCSVTGDGITSDEKATGAGGSDFCVATVPKGATANIVIYNLDGSSASTSSSAAPSTTSSAQPTSTSSSSSSSSIVSTTSTTSSIPSTTSTSISSSSSSSVKPTTSSVFTTSSVLTTSSISSSVRATATSVILGGIFQENGTSTSSFYRTSASPTATATSSTEESGDSTAGAATPSESKKSESSGAQGNGAIAGLIVAFVAAIYLL